MASTVLTGLLIESDDGKVLVNAASSYHVKVRVTFDDGTLGEFEDRLHTKDAGMKGVGAVVPVRVDPSDRSKIVVGGPELRRSGAPREEVGAWVHENEALDARFRALKAQHPDWTPAAGL